ncbi:MAG: ATP-grasp domain-containing protein [Deltaproteobacteria bacterium]|nr:ATP-grasp domain-containing protein [Deltaproteobacteria bacterium]
MPKFNKTDIPSTDSADPVVVVGTTPDYVARIFHHYPVDPLFILDIRHQGDSTLDGIEPSHLFFASLSDEEATLYYFQEHLRFHHVSPIGIACFDCEYLALASRLATDLHLPFPPLDAVLYSRNKLETRRLLKKAGVRTVSATAASDLDATLRFFHTAQKSIVIKPLSGSGSELVFHCRSEKEIKETVGIMKQQLPKRRENPLFRIVSHHPSDGGPFMDPCRTWLVEEYIDGPEYSCDLTLSSGQATIIRETGKVKALGQTFGSVLAYTCPPVYPEGFPLETLPRILGQACEALGFSWGYFMVDYIVKDHYPFIIEISPRPGGDSIPDLIQTATGRDTLGIYLSLICGRPFSTDIKPLPCRFSGSLNIFAPCEGRIAHMDLSEIQRQQDVQSIYLKKKVGDRITLPPEDYDNRLLGYCIVSSDHQFDPIALYQAFQPLVRIYIEK